MKRLLIILTLVGINFAVCGCQSFSGDITFRNESAKKLWVDHVEGFKHQPPCGILIPGATKASMMGRMEYPKEVVLSWSYDLHKADKRSLVVLRDHQPPSPAAELQIVFTPEQTWIARWKVREPSVAR
jgi:hypothetical protein